MFEEFTDYPPGPSVQLLLSISYSTFLLVLLSLSYIPFGRWCYCCLKGNQVVLVLVLVLLCVVLAVVV